MEGGKVQIISPVTREGVVVNVVFVPAWVLHEMIYKQENPEICGIFSYAAAVSSGRLDLCYLCFLCSHCWSAVSGTDHKTRPFSPEERKPFGPWWKCYAIKRDQDFTTLKIVIRIHGENMACEWCNSLKFTDSELEHGLENRKCRQNDHWESKH